MKRCVHRWITARPGLYLVLLASLGSGCQRVGDVTGTVSCADKPLPNGTVTLLAADGRTFQGAIDTDGTYQIEAVPIGPAKVAVTSYDHELIAKEAKPGGSGSRVAVPESAVSGRGSRILESYGDLTRSSLAVTIKTGMNQCNFALEPVKPPPRRR